MVIQLVSSQPYLVNQDHKDTLPRQCISRTTYQCRSLSLNPVGLVSRLSDGYISD